MLKNSMRSGAIVLLLIGSASNVAAAAATSDKKTLVLVVTCQRSGSSAMTGVLKILGLDLGNRLMGAKPANVKGHFEDMATVECNDRILRSFGTFHNDPKPLCIDWEKHLRPLTDKVKTHLNNVFRKRTIFGIKDPRVTLLLPAYLQAAQELGIELKVIRMYRDKREIIASLQARDNFSYENAKAVAMRYLTAIKEYCPLCEHMVVSFDDLMDKTQEVVDRITDYIPSLKKYNQVRKEITTFLDPALKHH